MHPREFNVAVHRFLNPSAIPAPRGYSHVVETKGPSRTIYLAGQLGMTADGKFAGGPGDFRAQATECFENIKAGLAAVGATFEHVVKLNNYLVDMVHLPVYFEVRDRYVDTKIRRPRPRSRFRSLPATARSTKSRRSRWCRNKSARRHNFTGTYRFPCGTIR